jgi:hypothetical protein
MAITAAMATTIPGIRPGSREYNAEPMSHRQPVLPAEERRQRPVGALARQPEANARLFAGANAVDSAYAPAAGVARAKPGRERGKADIAGPAVGSPLS